VKVIPISPRGYCPGVVNAINAVNKVVSDPAYPRPVYLLGMIVHNQFVVDHFKQKGVIALEDEGKTRLELLDSIHSGTVIITAHGVGENVLEKIREKGLAYVDATCKDVYKTHNLIKNYLASGYEIIYIGKAGHPETEGVLSLDPAIILIENEKDARHLVKSKKPVFVTNQTTFSIREIEPIIAIIRLQFPYALVSEEICPSTRVRQEAIIRQNQGVDLCLVVGDIHSNNTASLVKISREGTHTRTVRIASAKDLTDDILQGARIVSVTSGASTPTEITSEVIRVLENR
jgi:4-hydroxy-3-methylbut-2-enyl diphosphate reductase